MLSDQQLYAARRALALECELILLDCGVGNDVKWPTPLSAEIVAEPIQHAEPTTDTATAFTAVTGELSLTKRDVMLCRADGYDIAPGLGMASWFGGSDA